MVKRFMELRGRYALLLVWLVWLVLAAPAQAQNIVPNPNFDTQLSPWATFLSSAPDPVGVGTAPSFSSLDINNSPTSGSASIDIDTTTPAADAASGISQCVNFASTSVHLVNYGIGIHVPAATVTDGSINATVEMRLYSSADCSGFITGGSQGRTLVTGLGSDTAWYIVGDAGFVPPGGSVTALSADIRAYLREVNGVGPSTTAYDVQFDKAHLVLNSSTPVLLQHFDVE